LLNKSTQIVSHQGIKCRDEIDILDLGEHLRS